MDLQAFTQEPKPTELGRMEALQIGRVKDRVRPIFFPKRPNYLSNTLYKGLQVLQLPIFTFILTAPISDCGQLDRRRGYGQDPHQTLWE